MEFRPRDVDWAWLAGFIDGEGCFAFCKYKGKRHAIHATVRLSISQADRRVLDRVLQIVGKGSVGGPYANKGKGVYHYRLTGPDNVLEVAENLAPYLGQVKKDQFDRTWDKLLEWHME